MRELITGNRPLGIFNFHDLLRRQRAGGEDQTLVDRFFARRVNIGGISHVGGHGHGGIFDLREREKLRLADLRRLTVEWRDSYE